MTYGERLRRRRQVSGCYESRQLPPPWPLLRELAEQKREAGR